MTNNIACIIILTILTSCAPINRKRSTQDPLAAFNMPILYFNVALDRTIFEPVVVVYRNFVPRKCQNMLRNFVNNLLDPIFAFNFALQKKRKLAMIASTRFLNNSFYGLLGLFDIASQRGLQPVFTSFDDTLCKWGAPQGPYLILPMIGPSYARKTLGEYFDLVLNPGAILAYPKAIKAAQFTVERSGNHTTLRNLYISSSTFNELYATLYTLTTQNAPKQHTEKTIAISTIADNDDIFD